MSRLDELIKELCPDGVKYKPLKEATEMKRGTSATKAQMRDGEYPVISGGKEPAFFCDTYNREGETITVAGSGAGAGFVQYWNEPIYVNDAFSVVGTEELDTKFVYYHLSNIQEAIYATKKGSGVPHVHIKDIENFTIPVPPLEVQREIVRILDRYSETVNDIKEELDKELTARRKQYEYFCNEMVCFENELGAIPRIKLGELFEFKNGLSKGKEYFGSGIPFIRYTDVYNNRFLHKNNITALVECTEEEKTKLGVHRGDVLFTRTSETAEDVGWSSVMLDDINECVFNGFTIKATPKTDKLLPEYCAFCFSSNRFRNYVASRCAFTTRASLTGKTIAEYELPVPPLETQQRIADALMCFDKVCNSLEDGLPAEIEARQKQYEYYRDKLLTFKEKEA